MLYFGISQTSMKFDHQNHLLFSGFFAPLWVRSGGDPNSDVKWWFFSMPQHKGSQNLKEFGKLHPTPDQCMVYLPTFTIKINLNIGKYTVRPMDPHGYHSNLNFLVQGWHVSRRGCPAESRTSRHETWSAEVSWAQFFWVICRLGACTEQPKLEGIW